MIPAKRKLLRKKRKNGSTGNKETKGHCLDAGWGNQVVGRGITELGVGTSFLSLS